MQADDESNIQLFTGNFIVTNNMVITFKPLINYRLKKISALMS